MTAPSSIEEKADHMNAKDLMATAPITVCPQHSVWHAAQIMLAEHVSGIPVLSDDGALAGILTEGDLLRRTELGTEEAFADPLQDAAAAARAYVKSRSWCVADVMTKSVITIGEHASVREIAMLMNRHCVKRLPVMDRGRLVGIVSRADLLRIIATGKPDAQIRGDEAVRRAIAARLAGTASALAVQPEVSVGGGVVRVTGTVRSRSEYDIVRLVVESVAGPGFEDHLSVLEKPS